MGYFANDAAVPTARRRWGSGFAQKYLRSPRTDRRLMSLLLAAIGATVIALVEVTVVPYIRVGDVGPHPVLVGGVIWTIAAGIDRGIAWAFVGGLVLDSLLGRSLGTSALALLLAVGAAALVARPFPRLRLVAPIVAVPILSIVYSLLVAGVTSATQPGVSLNEPVGLFVPGAIYDALIGMFLGPIAVTIHDRRAATERVDW
jgi:rod shape-determining protein MreD